MKFQRRRGVSVIIATLLLIAIAVAASIIVYVFVNSIAGGLTAGGGQQTTERLQMQGYNFAVAGGSCACSGSLLQVFILNSGSGTSTVSTVYFDGALVPLVAATQTNTALPGAGVIDAFYTSQGSLLQDFTTTCSTTAGAANNYCSTVAGGATNGLGQLYNAAATGQIFFVFGTAPTAGTAHTVKVVTTTGATFVYSVSAGRSG